MQQSQTYQVIPPAYRKRIFYVCLLIFIAGLVLSALVFYGSISQKIGPDYGMGFKKLATLNAEILQKSLLIYGISTAVTVTAIVLLTMLYSHRIAGPLYCLTNYLKKVASGQMDKPVFIRKKDVVHALADDINLMVDSYRGTVTVLREEIDQLEQCCSRLDEDGKGDEARLEIRHRAEKIITTLAKYRI